MNAYEIKLKRINNINIRMKSGKINRIILRYLELLNIYPFGKVHIYIFERVIDKLFKRIKTTKKPAIKYSGKIIYSTYITGGVGDAIVIARLIRDIQLYFNNEFEFDVYFHSPNMIGHFFENIKGFREIFSDNIYEHTRYLYAFSLNSNTFINLNIEVIDSTFKLISFPKILKLYSNIELFKKRENLKKFIDFHPLLDGAFSDIHSKFERVRYSFMHEMVGIPYSGHILNINKNSEVLDKYQLSGVKYITIHDGWDENFKFISSRPTKSIPIITWKLIIKEIKKKFPENLIVQIGGPKGELIDGVDICLKNKTPFGDAISILGFSQMHFDSESGLVHLAAALGVKSMVFFGPTNSKWFSYPENINIQPFECGNCWWSTDSWMNSCPLGHAEPLCINHDEKNIIKIFNY